MLLLFGQVGVGSRDDGTCATAVFACPIAPWFTSSRVWTWGWAEEVPQLQQFSEHRVACTVETETSRTMFEY